MSSRRVVSALSVLNVLSETPVTGITGGRIEIGKFTYLSGAPVIWREVGPKEYPQTSSQVDYFLDFAHCISCGLCVDACPVSNTNTEFVGPQALGQAYRYNSDSRDQGEKMRLNRLDSMEGVWGCEYAGACSEVCPKGVIPRSPSSSQSSPSCACGSPGKRTRTRRRAEATSSRLPACE